MKKVFENTTFLLMKKKASFIAASDLTRPKDAWWNIGFRRCLHTIEAVEHQFKHNLAKLSGNKSKVTGHLHR